MAKRNKLTNSSDETEISRLISGDVVFTIPYFQRAYRWKPVKINQLIKDILKYKSIFLVICLLVFGNLWVSSQTGGSITGVVVETRQDDDQNPTLLLTVEGTDNAKADEVRVKLPKKVASSAKPGFVPEGWKLNTAKNYLSLTGKSFKVPLYLRLDLGEFKLPKKLDVEVLLNDKRLYLKKGTLIKKLPPVKKSDNFTSVLKLPPSISPGDRLFLQPFDYLKTPRWWNLEA